MFSDAFRAVFDIIYATMPVLDSDRRENKATDSLQRYGVYKGFAEIQMLREASAVNGCPLFYSFP